jgi:hypothetical protein
VKFLRVVDFTAIGIALLGFIVLIVVSIAGALSSIWQQLRFLLGHSSDRIVLIAVAAAVVWCILRWKELNKRP